MKKLDYFVVCIILSCSIFYFSHNLCGVQVHDDEGIYLYSAWRVSEGELPYRDFFDPQAPLSHFLMGYVFRLTGPSLSIARFGSVLAISMTALFIYLIGKTILNRICGIAASALFIFHPLIFSQGRLFMPESFMLLFYCAGVYLVVRGIQTREFVMWFLAGVSFGLSASSKIFGIFSVLGLVMFFVVQFIWRRVFNWKGLANPVSGILSESQSLLKNDARRIGLAGFGFVIAILFTFALLSFSTSNLYYDLVGHHTEKGAAPLHDIIGIFRIFFRDSQNRFLGILSIICLLQFIARPKPERLYLSLNLFLPAFFLLTHTVFAERHLIFMIPFLCLMVSFTFTSAISLPQSSLPPFPIPPLVKGEKGGLRDGEKVELKCGRKGLRVLAVCIFGVISFPLYFAPSWAENMQISRTESGVESVVKYIRNRTDANACVFCDYPSINFLAQRKLPPRLVDVGSTSTKTGVLDCNRIVCELQSFRPGMLLIRSGPPHHISALKKYRRKLNYDRFMSYVEAMYYFKTFLKGEDLTFAVYDRKNIESCNILPPFEAESLGGNTGLTVVDWSASQQMARYWNPELSPGDVVYDSCLKFSPGVYTSYFRLKLADIRGHEQIGTAEILSGDNVLIARRFLTTEDFLKPDVYQYFPMEFSLNEPSELLVRFRVNGKVPLWLDNIVFSLPGVEVDEDYLAEDFYGTVKSIRRLLYECEKLPHNTGSRKGDESASGGEIVRYSYGDDPPGSLVFGPYERYPAGEYSVIYRLKVSNNLSDGAILKLDVVSHSPDGETEVRAERELKAADFLVKDKFQDFGIYFVSGGYQCRLEFRVEVWGKADIEVDTITVEADD